MAPGIVQVGGTLDASAPDGGDSGFIETSGATVRVADTARVTTKASTGKTGTWRIDPSNFTIGAGSSPDRQQYRCRYLSVSLANTNVEIATGNSGAEPGDISVNAGITATGNGAGLAMPPTACSTAPASPFPAAAPASP